MNSAALICFGIASALAVDPDSYPDDNVGPALRQKETQTVVRELEPSLLKELSEIKKELSDLQDKQVEMKADLQTKHMEMERSFQNQIANLTQQIASNITKLQLGNGSSTPVAFFATLSSSFKSTRTQRIVFNEMVTDVGGGYNRETGVFTAPSDGLYVFSTTISLHLYKLYARLTILKNDDRVAWFYAKGRTGDSDTVSGTVLLNLNVADRVRVISNDFGGYIKGYERAFFSGYKL